MSASSATIRADFDTLAQFTDDGWDHNTHYHSWLLRHLPRPCTTALDVGCGSGAFARVLAKHATHVVALDVSTEMIRVAQSRSVTTNMTLCVADIQMMPLPKDHFDGIVSIATLHHLPLAPMLTTLRDALAVNGKLLVLDLYAPSPVGDYLATTVAVPTNIGWCIVKRSRLRSPRHWREAWKQHAAHDAYVTLPRYAMCVRTCSQAHTFVAISCGGIPSYGRRQRAKKQLTVGRTTLFHRTRANMTFSGNSQRLFRAAEYPLDPMARMNGAVRRLP